MVDDIFRARHAFRVAAVVSGVGAKRLQNWIDRGQIGPLNADLEREPGRYKRFSAFDMIRIAITKHLADFGYPIENAWLLAMGVFLGRAAINFEKRTLSIAEIEDRLHDRGIYAWHGQDGTWADFRYGGIPSNAPPAFLFVDVARIAREILEYLSAETEDAEAS